MRLEDVRAAVVAVRKPQREGQNGPARGRARDGVELAQVDHGLVEEGRVRGAARGVVLVVVAHLQRHGRAVARHGHERAPRRRRAAQGTAQSDAAQHLEQRHVALVAAGPV